MSLEPSASSPVPTDTDGVRLVQLGRGDQGRLASSDLTQEDCALLRALGLTDHCLLRVCQPGNPCIVQVRTTRIGLSQRLAEQIRVVPADREG